MISLVKKFQFMHVLSLCSLLTMCVTEIDGANGVVFSLVYFEKVTTVYLML